MDFFDSELDRSTKLHHFVFSNPRNLAWCFHPVYYTVEVVMDEWVWQERWFYCVPFLEFKPSFLCLFKNEFARRVVSERTWLVFQDMHGSLNFWAVTNDEYLWSRFEMQEPCDWSRLRKCASHFPSSIRCQATGAGHCRMRLPTHWVL